MTDLEFDLPKNRSNIIKVLGIGGGGSNAVSFMYQQGIKDVDFIVCNTDAQALELCPVPTKIQLGNKGLGAGSVPDSGRVATLENIDQIKEILEVNTKMLFITAGMGGGTGTGGAPVIAQAARELDILTVGIVTMPFLFEGRKRRQQAESGIEEMRKYVDTLLLVNNDKLRELYGDLKLSEAFHQADNILTTAAKGIAELITMAGYINVDFEDVRTVMKNSGKAIMGSETAEGENRALKAVQGALSSPLLNDNTIKGADNILLYINSGTEEVSLDEVSEITDYIQNEAGQTAEILWGNGKDEKLGSKISVTIIATGFDNKNAVSPKVEKIIVGSVTPVDKPSNEPESAKEPDDQHEELFPSISKPAVNKPESELFPIFPIEFNVGKPSENNSDVIRLKPTTPELQPKEKEVVAQNTEEERIFIPIRLLEPKLAVENSDNDLIQKQSQERIQRLKSLSMKMRTPGGLTELEQEPAYLRKKLEVKDPPPNTGQQTSRYTLNSDDENNTDIRSNNSYLFDNVD